MARRAHRATTASHRRRWPTKGDVALLLAGAGSVVNGLRLRRRATALHVLADTDEPVHHDHVFITVSGVTLDEATKRAASAHLTAEGLEVLDLLPGDLPVERALDVLRGLDPATYRAERTAVVRTPAQAMVVDKDVVRRAGIAEVDGIDVAAFVRLASSTKLAAPRTTDVAVAPHLQATPESVEQRYQRFAAMPPLSLSGQVVSESLQALAIVAGVTGALRRRSPWAPAAAIGMSVQPHLALAGTPLRPSDLAGQPLTRAAAAADDGRAGHRRRMDAPGPHPRGRRAPPRLRRPDGRRHRPVPRAPPGRLPRLWQHRPRRPRDLSGPDAAQARPLPARPVPGLRPRVPEPAPHRSRASTSTTGTSTTASAPTRLELLFGFGAAPTRTERAALVDGLGAAQPLARRRHRPRALLR